MNLKDVRDTLLPPLRVESRPFGGDVEALAAHVNSASVTAAQSLLDVSRREREFLDRLLDAARSRRPYTGGCARSSRSSISG